MGHHLLKGHGLSCKHECCAVAWVSQCIPRAKSSSIICTMSDWVHSSPPSPVLHKLHRLVPIMPNPATGTSLVASQATARTPVRMGSGTSPDHGGPGCHTWSSGHHVMIMQPCTWQTTSWAGHHVGGPGTWEFQLLFPFYLCPYYQLI